MFLSFLGLLAFVDYASRFVLFVLFVTAWAATSRVTAWAATSRENQTREPVAVPAPAVIGHPATGGDPGVRC